MFDYKNFCNLVTIFYLTTNHSFNKVCIILNQFFDDILGFEIGTSNFTVSTSTVFASIGKLFGTFLEKYNLRYVASILFLINGLSLLFCFFVHNYIVFIIFRNIQGLVSGIQASLSFGLIGKLKEKNIGFANFTGISAIVSSLTGILLFLISPFNIGIILISINFFASLLFLILSQDIKPVHTFQTINFHLHNVIKDGKLWYYGILLGTFLGLVLEIITNEKYLLHHHFKYQNLKVQNFLVSLPFIVSGITSFIYKIHKNIFGIIAVCICLVSILLSFYINSILLFVMGNIFAFVSFSIINPIICSKIADLYVDKYIVSSYMTSIRSMFTAATMLFLPMIFKPMALVKYTSIFLFINSILLLF